MSENQDQKTRIGKIFLTDKDLLAWPEAKWLSYLEFAEKFLWIDKDKEVYKTTPQRILDMKRMTEDLLHPWREFMDRINHSTTKPASSFNTKIRRMTAHALDYLKSHPSVITPAIEDKVLAHKDRWGSALINYTTTKTRGGGEIVTQNKDLASDRKTTLPSVQARIMDVTLKILDATEFVASSLTQEELRKMSVKDKIGFLGRMAPIILAMKKMPQGNHFTQINIQGSNRDLEKETLDLMKKRTV